MYDDQFCVCLVLNIRNASASFHILIAINSLKHCTLSFNVYINTKNCMIHTRNYTHNVLHIHKKKYVRLT